MLSSRRSTRRWRFIIRASSFPALPATALLPVAPMTEGTGRGVELLNARSCSRSTPATETAGVDCEEWKEGGGELGIAVL